MVDHSKTITLGRILGNMLTLWTRFEVVEGEHTVLQTDPSSSRVRKMIEHYHAWKFPEDEKFGDLTLYLRKQGLSA